jgi:hypothetical protein
MNVLGIVYYIVYVHDIVYDIGISGLNYPVQYEWVVGRTSTASRRESRGGTGPAAVLQAWEDPPEP